MSRVRRCYMRNATAIPPEMLIEACLETPRIVGQVSPKFYHPDRPNGMTCRLRVTDGKVSTAGTCQEDVAPSSPKSKAGIPPKNSTRRCFLR